jgi:hypothetical protein
VASILLIADREGGVAVGVASILARDGHQVTISSCQHDARDVNFQIAIVDLSHDSRSDWQNLADVLDAARAHSSTALVLAYSSVFRGVEMKIKVERMGARFIWI